MRPRVAALGAGERQATHAFQVFSSNRRGTNDGGTIAATRSRSHAPTNGVVRAPTVEHYAPDTPAALAWLSRRQPELWRERKELDISGTLEHRLSQMTPEERARDAVELAERVRVVLRQAARTIEHEPEE